MIDFLSADFWSILAAGFFVGIVVGLTGMGGGALMTPALLFLGAGSGGAAAIVAADLTAAAVYKSGGAIVHAREGSPNLTLAKWLIAGSVPFALAGPYIVKAVTDDPDPARVRAEDVDRLRPAAGRLDVRHPALHQPAPGAHRRRPGRPGPEDPPDPDAARRRPRRPARGRDQRGLRLGDHGRAADALPGPLGGEARRHRPGAGRAAGARRRHLQHRAARPGDRDPGPAAHRLGARHHPGQPDRPPRPAVVHPPRAWWSC